MMQKIVHGGFDSLGPRVHELGGPTGRIIKYIDEGAGIPLVFFGGAGTTVRATRLVEFARSLRNELGIRLISVERNGLGSTEFDPGYGYEDYAADVWRVCDELGLGDVSVVAISGGGPYSARFVAQRPDKVASYHLACAYGHRAEKRKMPFALSDILDDPTAWWTYPVHSAVQHIPGFQESAHEEALYGVYGIRRDQPLRGLEQAFELTTVRLPELHTYTGKLFYYWGEEDDLVPLEQLRLWEAAFDGRAQTTKRLYPGEGHDVQYRHWDQILVDVSHRGEALIVSQAGETFLVAPEDAVERIADGAQLGMAAWAGA